MVKREPTLWWKASHWVQGVNYPVGPYWVHGGFWNNSPNFYPVGKGWVFFKSTHQSTHWVTLWEFHSKSAHHVPEPLTVGSFKKYHQFDHNIPNHIPNGFFESLWENWTKLRTLFDYTEINPVGTFWSDWWVLFERTHTEWLRHMMGTFWMKFSKSYPVGTLVGTVEKYPPLTCWVKVRWIVSEPSVYSAWTDWVIDPLPPVPVDQSPLESTSDLLRMFFPFFQSWIWD